MIIGQELVINGCLCHGDPRITNTSLVVKVRVMAPTRSRKVRCQELQVTNNPAGAQADGGHHHQHSKTQSIVLELVKNEEFVSFVLLLGWYHWVKTLFSFGLSVRTICM